MVNTPLVVGMVFFGLAVVYFLFGRQRSRGYDADVVRGESILINETDGVCYVTGAVPLSEGKAQYRLITGEKKEVKRTYSDDELLDFSKVLNVVSRPMFISSAAVAALSGKIDFVKQTASFKSVKEELAITQAELIAIKNNPKATLNEDTDRIERILKAIPRGGRK